MSSIPPVGGPKGPHNAGQPEKRASAEVAELAAKVGKRMQETGENIRTAVNIVNAEYKMRQEPSAATHESSRITAATTKPFENISNTFKGA